MSEKMLRPDAKGRVTLGHLADGVSGFSITVTKDQKIVLEPHFEIPFREKWLYENKAALKKVQKGLQDAKAGHLVSKDSFSKYVDDDTE